MKKQTDKFARGKGKRKNRQNLESERGIPSIKKPGRPGYLISFAHLINL